MRQRTISAAVGLLLVLALVVAGCGGGKKNAATTASTTTIAVPTTTASATDFASAGNCKALADIGSKFASSLSGAGAKNVDPKQLADLLHQLADKAPKEIRADFAVVADAFSKVADAVGNLKSGATLDPATLAKLQKLGSELDTAKLTQASQHISSWVQKNCR